jgi:hypothetical protein
MGDIGVMRMRVSFPGERHLISCILSSAFLCLSWSLSFTDDLKLTTLREFGFYQARYILFLSQFSSRLEACSVFQRGQIEQCLGVFISKFSDLEGE